MKRSDFLRHNKYTNFQNNKDYNYYYTNIMCSVNPPTTKVAGLLAYTNEINEHEKKQSFAS